MIKIPFTQEQILELNRERYSYPHPRIQEKIEVLYLKSMGVVHGEICRLCRISRPTLANYLKAYLGKGIQGLKQWDYAGQPSELHKYSESLEAHFNKNPPMTSKQAVAEIEQLTGIRRSPTQVREYMRHIGMKFRKVGSVPKGSEEESKKQEQKEYVKKNSVPNCRKPRKIGVWSFS